MSLDVYLTDVPCAPGGSGIFIRERGSTREITREEWDTRFPGYEPVACHTDAPRDRYSRNITHNLNSMALAAGIYKELWHPDEIGIVRAAQLVEPLTAGLALLESDPARFEAFNPENGGGDYEGLVEFVRDYLRACETNPDARVSVSR